MIQDDRPKLLTVKYSCSLQAEIDPLPDTSGAHNSSVRPGRLLLVGKVAEPVLLAVKMRLCFPLAGLLVPEHSMILRRFLLQLQRLPPESTAGGGEGLRRVVLVAERSQIPLLGGCQPPRPSSLSAFCVLCAIGRLRVQS